MKQVGNMLVLETLDEIVTPGHTALLVIDIQNDNASTQGTLASRGVDISAVRRTIPAIQMVLAEARRTAVTVIFMRISKDRGLESPSRLRMREKSALKRDAAEYESSRCSGNEVLGELEPGPDERQFIKYLSSSFMGTPLDFTFRNLGIRSAVVVGMVTEGCVETTVRDLEQYGYYPVVLSDCVSSRRQDLHHAALLVMSARYDVITSEQLLAIWRRA